ncbi:EpsG family protein [Parabacteroides gordonii]|uniref:EpsG family protein n=1 Tax=Parabacteroides gordonii TaxID=574930 RepID=UPI00350E56EF
MYIVTLALTIYLYVLDYFLQFNKRTKFLLYTILYTWIIALLSLLRSDNIPDTLEYKEIYLFQSMEDIVETGFMFINKSFLSFGVSFHLFLLIYLCFLFCCYFLCTRKLVENVNLAFLLFLPYFGFYYFGIIIRVALAISICYIGITYLLNHKTPYGIFFYYAIVTIAFFIHQTTILFYILPLVGFINIKKKYLYVILSIGILLPFISLQNQILTQLETMSQLLSFSPRFQKYIDHADTSSQMYGLSKIKFGLCGILFVYLKDYIYPNKVKTYNFFLNTYCIGTILTLMFYFVPAGGRLGEIFIFFEFILLTFLYEYSSLNKRAVLIALFLNILIEYTMFARLVPEMI